MACRRATIYSCDRCGEEYEIIEETTAQDYMPPDSWSTVQMYGYDSINEKLLCNNCGPAVKVMILTPPAMEHPAVENVNVEAAI